MGLDHTWKYIASYATLQEAKDARDEIKALGGHAITMKVIRWDRKGYEYQVFKSKVYKGYKGKKKQ